MTSHTVLAQYLFFPPRNHCQPPVRSINQCTLYRRYQCTMWSINIHYIEGILWTLILDLYRHGLLLSYWLFMWISECHNVNVSYLLCHVIYITETAYGYCLTEHILGLLVNSVLELHFFPGLQTPRSIFREAITVHQRKCVGTKHSSHDWILFVMLKTV